MKIYTKQDVFEIKQKIINDIANGAVFIYPTDTIYGIGCDATGEDAVKRIRTLKGREEKPFSVIAPSLDWIRENCDVKEEWFEKLPGPYTIIAPLKNPDAVCTETNNGLDTIGIRIPDHWISEIVSEINKPIITTSVNAAGTPPATTQKELEQFDVDFIIYDGTLSGRPSTVIDPEKEIIKRR